MTLEELKSTMDNWRKNKTKKRERIPMEIWQEAIDLSKIHGIKMTAKTIGVHVTDLKRKVETSNGTISHPSKRTSKLPKNIFAKIPNKVPEKSSSNCRIELEIDGLTIRIYQ